MEACKKFLAALYRSNLKEIAYCSFYLRLGLPYTSIRQNIYVPDFLTHKVMRPYDTGNIAISKPRCVQRTEHLYFNGVS